MKTIFENNGGTYEIQGNYLLPNLALQDGRKAQSVYGHWRHKRFLKQKHKVLYYNLLTNGKLNNYLADIEQQAQHLFSRLVKDFAEKENITEQLKATDMMLWVQKINNVRNRATEIVNAELIYKV